MMMRRTFNLLKGRRNALLLALSLVLAAAADAGYYFAVCRPVGNEADALEARVEELGRENARAVDDLAKYESFMEGRAELDEFKSLLASRREYTDVLKKVYSLAKKDHMQFKSFAAQTSALRQVGDLEQLSFRLPVSGSYPNVRKFISDIETSDLFLNIDSLGLTSGGTDTITLSIGLSTYVRS